ncbi:bifunctional diguanylate cyclase/phosphodiesterase [Massilia sp. KIM]|uniref:putative bifunctional diguanylate cyclase/phosphodiesterase n=1 Tax=Massilia sp. KIM TaxID=1955422 RepID=UPI001E39D593|nr:EAL domain-containing protein [Massilia sp. KIM]
MNDQTPDQGMRTLQQSAQEQGGEGEGAPAFPGPGHAALEWLHHFVTALELAPAVAVHSVDKSGIVRFWNHACEELYHIQAAQAIGKPFRELVSHLEGQAEFDAMIAAIWREGVARPSCDWEVETCFGRRLWMHSCHYPVARDGRTQQVFCMEIDITARKQAEANLQRAAQVFQNARDAIVMMDAEYRVQAVNQAFTSITGHLPNDILGQTLAGLRWGAEEGFYERIWAELEDKDHWEGEMAGVRRSGERFPAWVALTTIRDPHGDVSSYMAMLSDISERKRAEEQVRHLAEHDPLTGLPNRILFLDRLHQALEAWRRHQALFAVMFLDLDRFKSINDTHGHQAGDAVLREVAARLRACVRRVDTISRLGGDEFVVLLADVKGADQAAHVAAAVTQALARPVELASRQISLSVSIGIALCPLDGKDVETLLHHADVAMYHAKQDGRNAFRFFSPAMNAHVVERSDLEKRLRHALDQGEFVLAWQPRIEVASGRVAGVEALLRWRHPERGLLLPEAFLAAAEESGLIVPIGEQVLREACRQARAWRDAGQPATLAVNFSEAQLAHPGLHASIDAALRDSGLEPGALELEIREDAFSAAHVDMERIAAGLLERGLGISIDGFGTGRSSLSLLRRLPLTRLKLDRSEVSEIGHAGDAGRAEGAMVAALIALARELRLRVVAEGVETATQLAYLRAHGCDEYQGYFAGPAQSRPDFSPRLP